MTGALLFAAALAGCSDLGDGGEELCHEWVATWNDLECVAAAERRDPAEMCPGTLFVNAIEDGCTWEAFYVSCIDSTRCDGGQPTEDCTGSCREP